MNCTIRVAKTKALISCAVTAHLICVFVFAYADCWFSNAAAHFKRLIKEMLPGSDAVLPAIVILIHVYRCLCLKSKWTCINILSWKQESYRHSLHKPKQCKILFSQNSGKYDTTPYYVYHLQLSTESNNFPIRHVWVVFLTENV